MTKPHILQVGRYPAGDQSALEAAFDMRRYFEAPDITATTSLYSVILNRRGAQWP